MLVQQKKIMRRKAHVKARNRRVKVKTGYVSTDDLIKETVKYYSKILRTFNKDLSIGKLLF